MKYNKTKLYKIFKKKNTKVQIKKKSTPSRKRVGEDTNNT